MNEREYQELREASWRRELTPAEEAKLQSHLAAHPELRNDWETDFGLTQLLRDMPDAPMPSNFTSQVLEALDRETAVRSARRVNWLGWMDRLPIPRIGWTVVVLGVGIIGFQIYRSQTTVALDQGAEMMVQALPPEPEVVLADFNAIKEMPVVPVVEMDEELWVALNQ